MRTLLMIIGLTALCAHAQDPGDSDRNDLTRIERDLEKIFDDHPWVLGTAIGFTPGPSSAMIMVADPETERILLEMYPPGSQLHDVPLVIERSDVFDARDAAPTPWQKVRRHFKKMMNRRKNEDATKLAMAAVDQLELRLRPHLMAPKAGVGQYEGRPCLEVYVWDKEDAIALAREFPAGSTFAGYPVRAARPPHPKCQTEMID